MEEDPFDKPGANARRMADAARKAAPIRSRLARGLGVHTDEQAWRKGQRGEVLVAARLDRLPPSWRVLHDITIDEAGHNVDHLIIGPGGGVDDRHWGAVAYGTYGSSASATGRRGRGVLCVVCCSELWVGAARV